MTAFCENGDGRKARRRGLCQPCFDELPESERLRRPGMEAIEVRVPPEHAERVRALARALRSGMAWAAAVRRAGG